MKRVSIYIVRHGETLFNIQNIAQGWTDSPLTEKGIIQAKCTGYGLRDIYFSKAYSGDLSRQEDTAKIILEQSKHSSMLQVNTDKRFRETNFGKYDGKPASIMIQPLFEYAHVQVGDYASLWDKVSDYQFSKCVEDSSETVEKMDNVAKRMYEGLKDICDSSLDGDNVLLVSSGCSINDLLEYLSPSKTRKLPDNCAVSVVQFSDENYQLIKFNDLSYRESGEKHFDIK